MPFCSSRCRQVDLGRWLDEKHTLPIFRDDEDEAPDAGNGADKNAEAEEE
jgi:endogenous inhibitor of DNA gyrase (YacG/DUF329 family)